jgi:hypothetical protein
MMNLLFWVGNLQGRIVHLSFHRFALGTSGFLPLIGAKLRCNGWEHWYIKDAMGALVVIDALREQVRKQREASGAGAVGTDSGL